MALGTRCQQLAMYVVLRRPALQMLSDSPSNYEREPESLEFSSPPSEYWDETVPLGRKNAEYLQWRGEAEKIGTSARCPTGPRAILE